MLYLMITLSTLLIGWGIYELVDDDDDETPETARTETNGTEGDDLIEAGDAADLVNAGAGDDIVLGGGGDDLLNGEAGDDIVVGQGGADRISGGDGIDLLQGRGGNDVIRGNLGPDWVEGDAGNDDLAGNNGADTVIGGTGADTLSGGVNNDLLIAGDAPGTPLDVAGLQALRDGAPLGPLIGLPADADISLGDDASADVLDGGDGNDALIFGPGDSATGGAGADDFLLITEAQSDNIGPAVIEDYDPAEDAIFLLLEVDGALPDLSVTNQGGDAVIRTVDFDVELARVIGAGATLQLSDLFVVQGIALPVLDPNS